MDTFTSPAIEQIGSPGTYLSRSSFSESDPGGAPRLGRPTVSAVADVPAAAAVGLLGLASIYKPQGRSASTSRPLARTDEVIASVKLEQKVLAAGLAALGIDLVWNCC